MLPINRYITVRNRTISNSKNNKYLVIHYVGAVSTALNNAVYFYSTYRGASAGYFVDDASIYQVVEDKDIGWHVGANSYKHAECRNSNSIGIEMCCFMNNGVLDVSETTVNNTLELAAYICKKYGITIDRVLRHYDVTGKNCPAPMVSNSARWDDFKNRLQELLNGGTISEPSYVDTDNLNKTMYVSTPAGLNVRSGAGTSYSKITALSYGTQVVVRQESNGWSRIDQGWVSSAYLSENNPTTVSTTTKYVKVNTSLNVRRGAGTNYGIVGSLYNGAQVTVYEERNGWSRIGDSRWVSSQYLTTSSSSSSSKYSLGRYKVNTSKGLNVRSGAGTNYSVKKTYTNGTVFDTYEIKNNWAKTPSGWVCLDYCTLMYKY